MALVSLQGYSAQRNRDVVRRIGRRDAVGQRNEHHTTNLVQGMELSATTPHLHPRECLRTYSLQSIVWCRGGRRIEPVPLGRRQFGSIARGDLLDAFLNMWLCCKELSIGNDIFDVAGAMRSAQDIAHRECVHSLLMHLPAYVPKCDARFVAYCGAPWRALRDDVKDRYSGKSCGLIRRVKWVVAVCLLPVKSAGVTFTGQSTSGLNM